MRCPTLAELPLAPAGRTGWPWTVESSPLSDAMPDGEPWPRISIITPSYNQGQFIEEAIRSVLLQGYPNIEYIIVDGGSADASVDIIRRYEFWISSWCSERDEGQSDAINKGLRAATGGIVAWLNSDDLLTPAALHEVAVRFEIEREPTVVCGNAEIRSTDLSTVMWVFDSPPTTTVDILAYPEGRHIGQPSVFMSRELLDFPEPLRGDLHYVMDLELWLRLSKKCDFARVSNALSWIRYHEDAKTYRDSHHVFQELQSVLTEYARMLSPVRKAELIRASRRQEARAYIDAALRQARTKRGVASFRLLLKALQLDLGVLSARAFYVVIMRICLPRRIQTLLLRSS